MKTVLEVITTTAEFFAKRGVESPRLNIEHLLAHVLGKKRMDLYMQFDRPLAEAELAPLRDLVRRRAQGEPLQHLLGSVEFLTHTLKCDARALIPRPETEQLCELLIVESRTAECAWKTGQIVDVGTGSGCIALSLATACPEAKVTGLDVSPDALALAQENATRTALSERVSFLTSDLLSAAPAHIHLLVANLPYIPTAEIATLDREVQRDPILALDGGADGLGLMQRLITESQSKLAPGGRIALEYGLGQDQSLSTALAEANFRDIKVVKDYHDRARFLFATHG